MTGSPLDTSVSRGDDVRRSGPFRSRRADLLGRVGLLTSSVAVIATATLLASWIH